MASFRELQEEQSGPVRALFTVLVGVDKLARYPLAALANLLQKVDGDAAVPNGAYTIEMHHRQRVGCRRVTSVQRLSVVQHRPLEVLIGACAREVHAGQIEHSVGRAAKGGFVEMVEGQAEVSGLCACTPKVDVSEAVVTQWIILRRRRHEVGVGGLEIHRCAQAKAIHVAQECKGSGMVSISRKAQVVLGFAVILPEAFYAEKVSLANCICYGGVAASGNLNEEVHLRRADDLSILVVQVQPDEFHSLWHACAVDIGDPFSHVDVIQRGRGACLGHAIALHVPVSHGH
mmetsp:Transcript_35041/g.76512  ORF Transcript_35041/g.76512 Transcript_35041/m.76512 type:complete len:289 (-) Transcript_35041:480-1346(-)